MLEKQLSINFFLKPNREKSDLRGVYLRITVDGIRKETSLSHKWDIKRWNQKAGRANGAKEDAKTLNYILDTIISRITKYKLELLSNEEPITASVLMDYIQGKGTSKAKVLEEFQKHNDEVFKLVPKEYAIGTHERYVTARSHVAEYIRYVYGKEDILKKHMQGKATYTIPEGGLAFWLVPEKQVDWEQIAKKLQDKGIKIITPTSYSFDQTVNGLRLGYGSLTEQELEEAIAALAKLL